MDVGLGQTPRWALPPRGSSGGSSIRRAAELQPLVRGTALLSLHDFLEDRCGRGAFARMVASLPPEPGAAFTGLLSPMAWYPTADFVALIAAARDHYRWPRLPEAYGEAAATQELTLFHRFILRFTSPHWLIRRGSEVWQTYHNTGTWIIEAWPRRIRGTLRNFGIVDGMYCRVLVGWLRRAGELTGARTMRVLHPHCRATGAQTCVFVGDW